MTIEQRFWPKVDRRGRRDCWLWKAFVDRDGYGYLRGDSTSRAHRVSWEIHHGPIPVGMLVLHSCANLYPRGCNENRSCVNPEHLYLGTDADNAKRTIDDDRNIYGMRNPNSKLSSNQVVKIRHISERGGYTYRQISVMFGVCRGTVESIVKRKRWRHL